MSDPGTGTVFLSIEASSRIDMIQTDIGAEVQATVEPEMVECARSYLDLLWTGAPFLVDLAPDQDRDGFILALQELGCELSYIDEWQFVILTRGS